MRASITGGPAAGEVTISVHTASATVADLAGALGLPRPDGLVVDGVHHAAVAPLSAVPLHEGAEIAPALDADLRPAPVAAPGAPAVHVVGGLDAGHTLPVPAGGGVLGRAASADVVLASPTVSAHHARIVAGEDVVLEDLASRNGTWVDGEAIAGRRVVPAGAVVRLGAVQVRIGPVAADDPAASGPRRRARLPLNRPPRPGRPAPPEPLALPAPPRPPTEAAGIGPAVIVGPLLVGAGMVLVLGSLRYALLAVLSPVLAVLAFVDAKVRQRRALRLEAARHARDLRSLAGALAVRRGDEVRRRRAEVPDPAEVVRRAATGSARLWERRPHHPDFLVVGAGTADLPWDVPVTGTARTPATSAMLAAVATLPQVPVPVRLGAGEVVGVVGDPDGVAAVARSLLCQAAVHAGPADLRIALRADARRAAAWDWLTWLPHLVTPGPAPVGAGAPGGTTALPSDRPAPGAGPAPLTLVVLDHRGDHPPEARALLRGDAGPATGVVLAATVAELPSVCTTVIDVLDGDGRARVHRPATAAVVSDVLATGMSEATARRCARHLARYDDPEAPVGPDLPDAVPLLALLADDATDPAAIAARWRSRGTTPKAPAVIGVSEHGPLTLELDSAPHLVVAGRRGSGTVEVVRTTVAALAARSDPDALAVLLVQLDPRAGLDGLAALPHVVGHVTDLPGDRARRLAEVVDGELARRRRAGTGPGDRPAPPRLVVAVDRMDLVELHHPDLGRALLAVAAAGTGTGVHLVLAGPTPPGPLLEELRAAAGFAIDLEAPAGDGPPSLRGRLRTGTGATPVQVQVATVSCSTAGRPPVEVTSRPPVPPVPDRRRPASVPGLEPGGSDLAQLVDALVAAAARRPAPPGTRPLWPQEGTDDPASVGAPGLLALLGMDDLAAVDLDGAWAPRPPRDLLRVAIGSDTQGQPVHLDLKESAQGGMGPHGLVIGATGSGKSELLRTLVTALALTHPPEDLAFILVDFKGGATFASAAPLPHVAGLLTNLEDDDALVARLEASLSGELRRRQQVLRRAGDLASVAEHRALRLAGEVLDPLPHLLVVIDEFAELLASRPELLDVLVAVGRLGRSLGLHLLLASQRLEEGRLRGLDSHLSYRVALRTFSATESRAVLGVADAFTLPSEPGTGLLSVGPAPLRPFRAALVASPAPPGEVPDGGGPTVAGVAARLAAHGAGRRAHQVWLPPLEPLCTLDQLLPPLAGSATRGLAAQGWPGAGRLLVPLGLVDEPAAQARSLLVADLAGAAGNVAIVGAPRSGTSTLLRTLLVAAMATHTPAELQVYAIDDGGGALAALAGAPHVGAVAGRDDEERTRRIVDHVAAVLAHRTALFRREGIDSAAAMRDRRAAGPPAGEDLSDVLLVVDGWAELRAGGVALEPIICDLAARGLGYGVHVVVTAARWLDVRPSLRDSIAGRLELRLAEPADTLVDRRAAALVPPGTPGRGLTAAGLHFQAALPRLDGVAAAGGLVDASRTFAARLAAAWSGPVAPGIRVLPHHVGADQLPAPGDDGHAGVPVALGDGEPALVRLDLVSDEPHLLVLGDGGSGKTTLLRTFLTQLCARCDPDEAVVVVVDPRRTLLEVVPRGHLLAHAAGASAAADAVVAVRALLAARLPGPEVTARALRERSWWTGPEIYVVVDDHDLVAGPGENPLAALAELLPQGRELGLHLVLARRVVGVTRAGFDTVLARLRDLGAPGIVLAGDPREGPVLWGHRADEDPPGRGTLLRARRAPVRLQVVDTPPPGGATA